MSDIETPLKTSSRYAVLPNMANIMGTTEKNINSRKKGVKNKLVNTKECFMSAFFIY